jgi:hypothetical protein
LGGKKVLPGPGNMSEESRGKREVPTAASFLMIDSET